MKLPAAASLALALAACNSQGGGSGPGGSGPAADQVMMQPGMWETSMRVISIEAPTAPTEIQERLRAAVSATPVSERSCLTPAEAANPAEAVLGRSVRSQPGFTCNTGEALFAGGRIRMTLNCRSTNGQPDQRQAIVGSYTAETLQAAVSGVSATPATDMMQSYPVRVESTLIGRRIGDCQAGPN